MDPLPLLKGAGIGVAVAAPVGLMSVLCMRRTLMRGWRSGFSTGLGIATGDRCGPGNGRKRASALAEAVSIADDASLQARTSYAEVQQPEPPERPVLFFEHTEKLNFAFVEAQERYTRAKEQRDGLQHLAHAAR